MEEFVSYFLASLISALGILGGYLIGICTKEELKKGEPYFENAGRMVLILTLLLFVYSLNAYKFIQFLIAGVVITSWNTIKQRGMKVRIPGLHWIYFLLAVVFYFSNQFIVLIGALILVYGVLEGTLLYLKKDNVWNATKPVIIFVVAANLLYLLF